MILRRRPREIHRGVFRYQIKKNHQVEYNRVVHNMPQEWIPMGLVKLEGMKNSQEADSEADEIGQNPNVFHFYPYTIKLNI